MPALLFVLLTLMHTIVHGKVPDNGFWYFFSAAINDLMIMILLSKLRNATKLSKTLMKICVGFIIANIIGWFMWMLSLDLWAYQYICVSLYIATIMALSQGDIIKNGDHKMGWRINLFHPDYIKRQNSI
jgi:hypothetical protein